MIPDPDTTLLPALDHRNMVMSGGVYMTYHGCVTDQCKNTPDRPSNMTSVTIELPFLNRAPAMAGSKANASDREAREDDSGVGSS
jgi:hypothetical protein